LINDLDFFTYLEKNIEKIKDKQLEILQEIIFQSCQNKAKIVATDETEQGTRALLNLGHTFGHIFETETGYSDKLFHGEAVAIGMVMAAKMSEKLGLIDNKQIARIIKHLKQSNLPTSPQQIAQKWHIDNLLKHLYKDKKVKNNQLTFILMKGIGQSFIKENVSENLFLEVLDAVINN
jgi:3-dehydroquinate synthase